MDKSDADPNPELDRFLRRLESTAASVAAASAAHTGKNPRQ
jgi:hypothetical protein